jgi:hypothetical protein
MPFEEPSIIEPRRKRVKIVSACGECRRKKTKCNGEHPCRNCEKSGVACIYPMAQNDDKRPSKQALEAIEERLKTIEDMLRTIIKTQHLHQDMDPAIHQFLHNTKSSPPLTTTTATTSPPPAAPPLQQNRLPSIQSLSSSISENTTTKYGYYPDVKVEEEEDYLKKRKR